MNFLDDKTWTLLQEGRTKGVFQLESNLGKSWSKKVHPCSIEELSALIAIIRPGCVSGDTKVTIRESIHTDGRRRYVRKKIIDICLSHRKHPTVLSLDRSTNLFVDNSLQSATFSGVKECFKVNTCKYSMGLRKSRQQAGWIDLECTADHQLFVWGLGWVELQNIPIGSRIAALKKKSKSRPIKEMVVSRHHSDISVKNTRGLKYYAEICYKNYIEECVMCDWSDCTLDVHHINGNRHEDNSKENLAFLCPNCHRKFNSGIINNEEILVNRLGKAIHPSEHVEWITYLGRTSVGEKPTYDLSMQSPHNSFIAGNVVVHNCLNAMFDGKSMSQHFVDRKSGKDETKFLHPSLEPILKQTYGVLVYQEQAMRIAQELAGFDLIEADDLRKAIGKKKADLMALIKVKFIAGCKETKIVSEDEGAVIFGWIEKSARYSFNKSHSVSYAFNSFTSAHYKANYPIEFFVSYLRHAKDSPKPHQEVYELVSDAKMHGINSSMCKIDNHVEDYSRSGDHILFGVKSVKGMGNIVGTQTCQALIDGPAELGKDLKNMTWLEILLYIATKCSKTGFEPLCSVGFFNTTKTRVNRNTAQFEYDTFRILNKNELAWAIEQYPTKKWKTLKDCLVDLAPTKKQGGGTNTVGREKKLLNEIHFLDNPPYELVDDPQWVVESEINLLGCPLSMSKLETSETVFTSNSSCKEIVDGKHGKNISVAGNVYRASHHKTKKGKSAGELMSFLTIEDESGSLESVVIFPKVRKQYSFLLYEGNNLLFHGEVKRGEGSLLVEKIHEI